MLEKRGKGGYRYCGLLLARRLDQIFTP